MGKLRGEYVYTATGPQRPVFLCADARKAWFGLEVGEGAARVQVTHDPVEAIRAGKALWEEAGSGADGLYGVTALRCIVEENGGGWVSLVVEQARD